MTHLNTIYIPVNSYGIPMGYYSINKIVTILRVYSGNPDIIHFIADMLEE